MSNDLTLDKLYKWLATNGVECHVRSIGYTFHVTLTHHDGGRSVSLTRDDRTFHGALLSAVDAMEQALNSPRSAHGSVLNSTQSEVAL